MDFNAAKFVFDKIVEGLKKGDAICRHFKCRRWIECD